MKLCPYPSASLQCPLRRHWTKFVESIQRAILFWFTSVRFVDCFAEEAIRPTLWLGRNSSGDRGDQLQACHQAWACTWLPRSYYRQRRSCYSRYTSAPRPYTGSCILQRHSIAHCGYTGQNSSNRYSEPFFFDSWAWWIISRRRQIKTYSLVGSHCTTGPSGRTEEAIDAEAAKRAIREALIETCILLFVSIDGVSVVRETKTWAAYLVIWKRGAPILAFPLAFIMAQ